MPYRHLWRGVRSEYACVSLQLDVLSHGRSLPAPRRIRSVLVQWRSGVHRLRRHVLPDPRRLSNPIQRPTKLRRLRPGVPTWF
jgi:hypothetical protein